MGEIGDVTARAFEIGGILFKQRVELVRERPYFLRLPRWDSLAAPYPHIRQRLPQAFEWPQS